MSGPRHVNEVIDSVQLRLVPDHPPELAIPEPVLEEGVDPELVYLMNIARRRLESVWEIISSECELGPSDAYFALLNALQLVAAEHKVPPASMDTYLRYMANYPDSYLNLYRDQL